MGLVLFLMQIEECALCIPVLRLELSFLSIEAADLLKVRGHLTARDLASSISVVLIERCLIGLLC